MNTRKILIPAAILVTLTTFVYLYIGLHALAVSYIGLENLPAVLFPFAIDAATLVFLVAALDHRVKGTNYLFVWSCVVLLSAVSVVAQYIAHPGSAETPLAPWLASVPAATLIFLTHLLWIVAQDSLVVKQEAEKEAVRETILAKVTDGAAVGMLDRAVEALQVAQEAGQRMTGSKMAEILNLYKDNGSPHYSKGLQWMKRAEEATADA